MRIVMIGPFGLRPRGTMGVRALPMAQALAARGYHVTVLMPPWQTPEESGRCWEEAGVAIEYIVLPPSVPGLFYALVTWRLVRRVLALRPDVVHMFKPKAYSGLVHWVLRLLPRRWRPRLVVDSDDWEGPGGWNDLANYSAVQRAFFAWQERWGLTHADALTVASRALETLAWALGVPPAEVYYLPNAIRPAAVRRRSYAGGDVPVVLLYTRFFEFPVSRVIEVFAQVRQQVPEARLLVVGQGLFGEEQVLFDLAAQAGWGIEDISRQDQRDIDRLEAPITYAGWVPVEMLPVYFERADVALYPFDDTLVNRTKCAVKLLDLLAAGVPVVAEAVGQNNAYIQHGESGWLVPSGDIAAFAAGVVQLLEDASLRRRLGQAAARNVRSHFSWERLVTVVEEAYRRPGK